MTKSSYDELDYAFGQMMLTLRANAGLTQAALAERLGVSRRTVAGWEAGSAYPKTEHLKAFLELCVQQQAFPAGHKAEQIRTLWHAARQKVLLDETWLAELLGRTPPALTLLPTESLEEPQPGEMPAAELTPGQRVDWGDALAVSSFYNREREVTTLAQWVVQERCRVVSVLGLGGIGKSALAVSLMHQVAPHFEVVLWRSLRDAPSCDALLEDCLQVLALQPLREVPTSLDGRLGLLLEHLRAERALLVLDNLEMLLEEGEGTGHMRAGYEAYGRLLRRIAGTEHQSCLLLTSREKPRDLVSMEGSRTPVRALRLGGLEREACEQLLEEQHLAGSADERVRLIERYGGNPLALKVVAQTIVELYGGKIAPFLTGDEVVFGSVRELLAEQFDRLSAVEQLVLQWLAIHREPVSIVELLSTLGTPLPRIQVLEAVESLRRRSLVERGKQPGSFTLQSVVLEYVAARLIAEAAGEIAQGRLARLIEHGLELSTAREDVRQTQQRLIVAPILASLRSLYRGRVEVEEKLLSVLDQLRELADYAQGYGPANVISLLRVQRGHLRSLDLSHLVIRGSSLQGVEMQDTSLAGATVRDSTFTQSFDATWSGVISGNGTYWAIGSRRGEVQVWHEGGKILHLALQAHTDTVKSLVFSPDERTLATSSWDGAIKLWDLESGTLLWTIWQTYNIYCIAFSPDGQVLASGGDDATVRLWDAKSGAHQQTLTGHTGPVFALAWSPTGGILASGGFDTQIRLWERPWEQPEHSVRMLTGHTNWVFALAFAPDGRTLASGSTDQTVRLWEVANERVRETLTGHTSWVMNVAWSHDGGTLASCGLDHIIWLWDSGQGSYRAALHGHTAGVYGLAFTPDNHNLFSGSLDGTLRVWEVESGQCVHVIQSYAVSLYDVAWSPDGSQLASAGTDLLVTMWDIVDRKPPRLLQGHSWAVFGLAWSPDGRWLASSGWDNAARVWDLTIDTCVQIFRDPDHVDNNFQGIAWSPDGKFLANGSYQQGLQVWDVTTSTRRWVGHGQPTKIRRVAWCPDGTLLASCGDDGSVCLWQASDGTLLKYLSGHRGIAAGVAWSPDGIRLASGGGGRGNGELFIWEARSWERLYTLSEPNAVLLALAWSPRGTVLISGGSDGLLRWWDLRHGECVRVRKAHQGAVQSLKSSPDGTRLASCGDDGAINIWDVESGEHLRTLRRDRPYERMDISGVQGLTEAQKASLRALGAVENRE
jgi:WD40 repeat protein/transcriptional regulator with XRE-family HTH domain